jgi:uncharacterized repeat protein (TIGR01451 family)
MARTEWLEQREVPAVVFTGNVLADFPSSSGPGVKYLVGGAVDQPIVPPDLQSVITKTGFDLEGIALSYDPITDVLYIGILQPVNGIDGRRVIAGDADNNLNSATESPAVSAIDPLFTDFADLLSTEGMGVYFDLNNDGTPDIIAGINDDPFGNKQFQVAQAVVVNPAQRPAFGSQLTGYAGNIYLMNSADHPAMEFSISNFKQLYQQVIGSPLTTNQAMKAGAFGSPSASTRISEAHYKPQGFTFNEVSPVADLAIRKIDAPDPVQVGGTLVYTILVNNLGPYTNPNVLVSDTLPSSVELVSIVPSQGTYTQTANGFSASMGTIAAGGSASITVVVRPKVAGTIVNTATVSSGDPFTPDPNPNNDKAVEPTTVVAPPICPPITVNPHESGIIDTAQSSLIRVYVFGSANFDVMSIDMSTVTLSGAKPVGEIVRKVNNDGYLDRTFIFNGADPAFDSLPAGYTTVIFAGKTTSGATIQAQSVVLNKTTLDAKTKAPNYLTKQANDLTKEAKLANPRLRLVDVLYPGVVIPGINAPKPKPAVVVRNLRTKFR